MSVGKLLPQAGSLFQGTWVKAGSDNVVNEDIDVVVMRLVKVVMGSWRMMVLWVTMVWVRTYERIVRKLKAWEVKGYGRLYNCSTHIWYLFLLCYSLGKDYISPSI